MRGICIAFLVSSLCLQWVFAALPFTCGNTHDLLHDSSLDGKFTTTYGSNYFFADTSIFIEVKKDASYDQSNVKGIFLSVFGLDANGDLTSSSYGDFPIVTSIPPNVHTIGSPCSFIFFDSWPGDFSFYWKSYNSSFYPEQIRLCVGIAVSESPLTGYVNCMDVRKAQAVTKPSASPGNGVWNNNIDLSCMVTVFPAPAFYWYYNGIQIQANDHYTILDTSASYDGPDGHQSILSVVGARTYDTIFKYSCAVTNVLQNAEVLSDDVSLTISDLGLKLLDSPNLVENGFLEGTLVIMCKFAAYPRPMIIWKKNNTRLYNTSLIAILPGHDTEDESDGIIVNSRLAFSSLAYSDAGQYTCEALRGGTTAINLPYTFTLGIISASSIIFLTPDSVAVVNSYVTLNCQASGIPIPSIKWYNNAGMEIGTSSSISVRVMNSGVNTWTCEASNEGGTDTASTSVTGYITPASITTPPGDTTVRYRDTASFVCEASGNPTPVVKWYFTSVGGSEIELTDSDEKYTISASSLVIQKPTLSEKGTYRCEASNVAGPISVSATLTIQIVRPTVQIMPTSQEVDYDTAHTITCTAGGMPPPVQTIKKPDGSKVGSPYTIESFTENDVGQYFCIATNPANGEVATQSAIYSLPDLYVSVAPTAASIEKSSTSVHSFNCSVGGIPTYETIKWFHKNPCSEEETEILGTESGFSLSNPEVLTVIPKLVVNFLSGDYICEVERYSLKYRGSASLTVTSLTDSVTINPNLTDYDCPILSGGLTRRFQCNAMSSESNAITYSWFLNQNRLDPGSDSTQITLAAGGYGSYRCVATAGQQCGFKESDVNGGLSVGISPATQVVQVEDSFSIYCNAAGFPTVAYTWAKDGLIINPSQTNSVLTIGAATTADSGVYTCSVTLAACTSSLTSSNSNVNVIQTSPSISTTQQDFDVRLGNDKTLVCTASGSPAPSYQWYKDLSPIANAESNTYTISSVTVSDNGLYACEVFSYVSRSFQSIASISIYQLPQDIQLTVGHTGDVKRGTSVTLSCSAVGIPSPDYSWFDGDNILYGNSWMLEVVIENEIEFTCVARNSWGDTRDSVTITIVPDPTSLLIILPVVLGTTALIIFSVMICLVCLMWVYNCRRMVSDNKGEIAEDSNVLLADQVDQNTQVIAPLLPAESISSESSMNSIMGDLDDEKVGNLGGLEHSNPLTGSKLQDVITTVEKTGGFDGDNELNREFESTPSNMAKWTTIPKNSETKNRYMNVMPNPDTMVQLSDTGESGSTFINANFITDYRSKKTAYISTQGPLPSTIVDFWRMVWENDVSAIIMTCLLFERKRIRCARYWPDTQQRPTEIYGHFKVSIDSFAKAEDYEVSLLYIFNLKAGPNEVQKKQVYHYWYKNWPSYGVPRDTNKVWKFLEEINNTVRDSNKPMLFHCSAGIGRTAVFIGADMGMREFKSSSRVDPLKYLCLLRKGRGGSIQTAEQYLYLHRMLSDFIRAKQTAI